MFVIGILFLFASSIAHPQSPVSYRVLQETSTGLDLLESGVCDFSCRGTTCFFTPVSDSPRTFTVEKPQVLAAQRWVKRRNISLKVEGGGRLKAIAESLVVLEVNGKASVGLQVLYEDFVPEEGLKRALRVLKSIVPLDQVDEPSRVNPLSVAIADQEYLLGSTDASALVVPVYVLGRRTFQGLGTFYFVVQARDFLQEEIQNGTIYLVPSNRLREALSEGEYEASLRDALVGKMSKERVRFHQQVLMPWTHQMVNFKTANDPEFAWEDGIFARRATQALVLLGAEPDSDEKFAVRPSTCADFLYKQTVE